MGSTFSGTPSISTIHVRLYDPLTQKAQHIESQRGLLQFDTAGGNLYYVRSVFEADDEVYRVSSPQSEPVLAFTLPGHRLHIAVAPAGDAIAFTHHEFGGWRLVILRDGVLTPFDLWGIERLEWTGRRGILFVQPVPSQVGPVVELQSLDLETGLVQTWFRTVRIRSFDYDERSDSAVLVVPSPDSNDTYFYLVDFATGNYHIVGAHPMAVSIGEVAFDGHSGRAYVLVNGGIKELNLSTGSFSTLSTEGLESQVLMESIDW